MKRRDGIDPRLSSLASKKIQAMLMTSLLLHQLYGAALAGWA